MATSDLADAESAASDHLRACARRLDRMEDPDLIERFERTENRFLRAVDGLNAAGRDAAAFRLVKAVLRARGGRFPVPDELRTRRGRPDPDAADRRWQLEHCAS